MFMSQKCRYALRAVLELALREAGKPVKVHDIADAQNIPPRFLGVILNQLRHAGFVESQRGNAGGYMLARAAEELSVGEIIEYIQGPIWVTAGPASRFDKSQSAFGNDVFGQLWVKVNSALSKICDDTNFAELVAFERAKRQAQVPNYCI